MRAYSVRPYPRWLRSGAELGSGSRVSSAAYSEGPYILQMPIITNDDPIPDESAEQLGRAPYAKNLAALIDDAPSDASYRLGIYGDWGEGKSSVLKLMQRYLEQKSHVVVWLSPWSVKSSEEFVERLLRAVATKLEVNLKSLDWSQWAGTKVGDARKAVASSKLSALDLAIGKSLQKLADDFAKGRKEKLLPAIISALGKRKLVVFVDDLDRARPEIIPDFLLAIREVLALPNFFFVLALSPEIVHEGLGQIHRGWGRVESFLEKIVEWPSYLPVPTPEDLARFAKDQTEALSSALDANAVANLGSVLPTNPRKLKVFLRFLSSLRSLLIRFDADELDLESFYLCQMLRLEFPTESRNLLKDQGALREMRSAYLASLVDAKPEASLKAKAEEKYAPIRGKARFLEICSAIRERQAYDVAFSLSDLFLLVERPPILTWRELQKIWSDFKLASPETASAPLRAFVASDGAQKQNRAEALFVRAVELRERLFSHAVDQDLESDIQSVLDDVASVTRLLTSLLRDLKLVADGRIDPDAWGELLNHISKWSHWETPSYYAPARADELELLTISLSDVPAQTQLGILEYLHQRRAQRGGSSKESAGLKALLAGAEERFSRTACEAILDRFRRGGGVSSLLQLKDSAIEKIFALSADSPFHAPPFREELIAILENASADAAVHQNAFDYLYFLLLGAYSEHSLLNRGEAKRLLADPKLMAPLWKAALARPLNRRVLGTMMQYREIALKELSINPAIIPVPKSWVPPSPGAD